MKMSDKYENMGTYQKICYELILNNFYDIHNIIFYLCLLIDNEKLRNCLKILNLIVKWGQSMIIADSYFYIFG